MKASEFTEFLEDFRTRSLINKTITTVFLISANSKNFTVKIEGYPRQIRDSLVEVLVDNPDIIKHFDGACRRARAILKNTQIDESTDATR